MLFLKYMIVVFFIAQVIVDAASGPEGLYVEVDITQEEACESLKSSGASNVELLFAGSTLSTTLNTDTSPSANKTLSMGEMQSTNELPNEAEDATKKDKCNSLEAYGNLIE